MLRFKSAMLTTAIIMVFVCVPARGTVITDPSNDFLSTFAGTHSADLDVLSVFATFDGTTFHIGANLNGNVGTLPSALYVFGFNRGAANNNFSSLGLPGIVFDAVITMTAAGVTGGRDLVSNTPIALPLGAAKISGSTFQIDIPASLLPSQGLAPLQYGINLWPRDASVPAGDTQIADFAPNSTDFNASAVPEPSSAALLTIGVISGALLALRKKPMRERA